MLLILPLLARPLPMRSGGAIPTLPLCIGYPAGGGKLPVLLVRLGSSGSLQENPSKFIVSPACRYSRPKL